MTTPQVKIVNAETGEEIIRDMNADELKQYNADKAAKAIEVAALAEAETAKKAAQAKLAAIGLTADDLKALGL